MAGWAKLKHEIILSYLPLSHIAAQITDIWIALVSGSTVYFAQPDVLKVSNLISYLLGICGFPTGNPNGKTSCYLILLQKNNNLSTYWCILLITSVLDREFSYKVTKKQQVLSCRSFFTS